MNIQPIHTTLDLSKAIASNLDYVYESGKMFDSLPPLIQHYRVLKEESVMDGWKRVKLEHLKEEFL